MKPIAVLPTLCTLGNAVCGLLAIAKGVDAVTVLFHGAEGTLDVAGFHSRMATACFLVFLAMIFDALDGRIARITRVTSDFGAQLDSLIDMLTFGVAPALLAKFLFECTRIIQDQPTFRPKVVFVMCALYVCAAALRLARFTVETDDDAESHDFFRGLPTPAAAACLSSLILFYVHLGDPDTPALLRWIQPKLLWAVLFATPILGLFMISRIQYVHLANRYMRGKRPYTYVAQIVFVLILLAVVTEWALFLGAMTYVLAGPLVTAIEHMSGRKIIRRTPSRELGDPTTLPATVPAVIALGSNLGDRQRNIEQAIETLDSHPSITLLKRSSIFDTEPEGGLPQPRFLNGVVLIETQLSPWQLLDVLHEIEKAGGRTRTGSNEPRTIDLDLLFYSDKVIHQEGLVVPHPRAHERRFVLEPLAQIAPDWVHPEKSLTISELLSALRLKSPKSS